jgi:hypothetical protein
MTDTEDFMLRGLSNIAHRHEILSDYELRLVELEEEFVNLIGKPKSAEKKLVVATKIAQLLKTSAHILDLTNKRYCLGCQEATVVEAANNLWKCFRCDSEAFMKEATG